VSLKTLRDPVAATCAQEMTDVSTTPRDDDSSLRFDAHGYATGSVGARQTTSTQRPPDSEAPETADATMEPPDDGAYLIDRLLDCAGAGATNATAPGGSLLAPGDPYPRLRAVIQTAAIIAGFLLLICLAYLIAAMTRSTRHARAGRRRY